MSGNLDLSEGGWTVLLPDYGHELARIVLPALAGSARVELVNKNRLKPFESVLRGDSRGEFRPLSQVRAGLAGPRQQRRAPPDLQDRLPPAGRGTISPAQRHCQRGG